NYVYALSPGTIWVNLYGASTLDTAWAGDGQRIKLRQETDYPWSGAVKLVVEHAPATEVTFKLRVPGWLREGASLRVNGRPVSATITPGSYANVKRA
ncbi:MAG TPA: glycoside hydrolase family 127 protein, partial [Opitutaceae bacterium]|nr:glycoside hydrolase family 127 protein [Opitutaceae bacterium]